MVQTDGADFAMRNADLLKPHYPFFSWVAERHARSPEGG